MIKANTDTQVKAWNYQEGIEIGQSYRALMVLTADHMQFHSPLSRWNKGTL
jgi:hypothetical protein